MPATITPRRLTSTGPTATNVAGINTRLDAQDAHSTGDTTNTVAIPTSGNKYSYWGSFQLSCDAPPVTLVNNLKFYSDAANSSGTGITCVGNKATSYVQATGTPGAGGTGTQLTTGNYASLSGAPTDVFGWTSVSPLSLSGTANNSSSGLFGDIVVIQFVIASTAGPGPSAAPEGFTFSWDES